MTAAGRLAASLLIAAAACAEGAAGQGVPRVDDPSPRAQSEIQTFIFRRDADRQLCGFATRLGPALVRIDSLPLLVTRRACPGNVIVELTPPGQDIDALFAEYDDVLDASPHLDLICGIFIPPTGLMGCRGKYVPSAGPQS